MARFFEASALWKVLRTGDPRARLRVTRDGTAAIRLHVGGAAIATGVLDALAAGSATTQELARRTGATDENLCGTFLRVVASVGLVSRNGDTGPWRLTGRGRAAIGDPLVRASYEGFSGFHTGLYRELGPLLSGGPRRRDIVESGELIARLSGGFEPLVLGVLQRTVAEHAPRRLLDVGCGAALELAVMLEAAPQAVGVGIDVDADAVELAGRTLARRSLDGRASVLHADVREAADHPSGPLAEPFDLGLVANVLYYLPMGERVDFLRRIAGLLAPGGVLVVVTTVAAPSFFSRHFDLLLQAQEGHMELSDADTLRGQLTRAGFTAGPVRPVAMGMPVVTVTASLPG